MYNKCGADESTTRKCIVSFGFPSLPSSLSAARDIGNLELYVTRTSFPPLLFEIESSFKFKHAWASASFFFIYVATGRPKYC